MTDPARYVAHSREADFYLARLLGPKLAVLVVFLVLYLSVRHQLIANLDASTLNLGLAHAEASVKLALFGEPHTVTRFSGGGRTYDFTRYTIAHADLFAECWQAMLWQIERGVVAAVVLVAAPPIIWFIGSALWELWHEPEPEQVPVSPRWSTVPIDDLCAREVPPPPLNRFEPAPLEEVIPGADDGAASTAETAPTDAPVPPTAVPRKRIRKRKASQEPAAQSTSIAPPLVQPGQVRKRPRREG